MVIYGGLRDRMIEQALWDTITAGLSALGWFDAGRYHEPINFVARAVDATVEVPVNTLALSGDPFDADLIELGSTLAEERRTFWVDFFAENDALGKHLIGDVRDLLRGRMPHVGRDRPILEVYDYTQGHSPTSGHPPAFVAELSNVQSESVRETTAAHKRSWFLCRFEVVHEY